MAALALGGMAACYLASMPWLRAYQVPSVPILLAIAACAPFLLTSVLSRALRFDALVALGASVAVLALVLVAASQADVNLLWQGLTRVPAQLLTETLPLGGPAWLATAPVAVTWLCSTVCAELLLRPSAPWPAALGLPLVSFSLAYLATTTAPPGHGPAEAAGLLITLVAVALTTHGLRALDMEGPEAHAPRTRPTDIGEGTHHGPARRAAAAGSLAAVLVAGLGVGVPSVAAFSSRPATITRPTRLLGGMVVDPVDVIASLRSSHLPGRGPVLYTVHVDRPWWGYMAAAVLDHYDGELWSFGSTFRPTGGRVPLLGPAAGTGRPLQQEYQLVRSIGVPFLPAVERPLWVSGTTVDADAVTGMLASEATGPVDYTVDSAPGDISAEALPAGTPLLAADKLPDGAALTQIPEGSQRIASAAVRFAVDLTGRPAAPSFAFLQDLAATLATRERRVVARRAAGSQAAAAGLAGTSLAQVMNAVTVVKAATPEQFATYFAVVARYLGTPVRLVSGFRLPLPPGPPGPLPPGTYTARAGDAWTWDEVPVAGRGWVTVDAAPSLTTTDASPPPEQVTPAKPHKPAPPAALPRSAQHALARPARVPRHSAGTADWGVLVGAGLPAALVLALLMVVVGAPATRRRLRRLARHRADDPALLTAGAWLELVDGMARLGLEVRPAATSQELARSARQQFGEDIGPLVGAVAELADRAVYSSRWAPDAQTADYAWQAQAQAYRALLHQAGWRRRARALAQVGPAPAKPLAKAGG